MTPHALRLLVAEADADPRAGYRAAFANEPWDLVLVLTAVYLPFIDGISFYEILRRDRATKDVPIAVMTRDPHQNRRPRALQAGADVVLTTPTSPEKLVAELRRLLTYSAVLRRRGTAAIASAEESLKKSDDITKRSRVVMSKIHERLSTTAPALTPPVLHCPECLGLLTYDHSWVGGVSARDPEQWDYYTCPQCGTFQHRHRTRRVRKVG